MAEVLVIGKKISEMGLVNEITGEEKIPTSALGDKAVTTGQLLTYVNNNGVAQWGRIGGDINDQVDLQNQFSQQLATLQNHIQDQGNPHNVTKEQVGLGLADNTADMDKPVSTAVQEALSLKADQTYVDDSLANKTHNSLLGRDADGAHPASAILDASGISQQEINDNNRHVESISDLLAIPSPKNGIRVSVKGYHAESLFGGGDFVYSETSTLTADNGIVFDCPYGGKWVRLHEGKISYYDYGAKGDGVTDDTLFVERSFTNPYCRDIVTHSGTFLLTRPFAKTPQRTSIWMGDNARFKINESSVLTTFPSVNSSVFTANHYCKFKINLDGPNKAGLRAINADIEVLKAVEVYNCDIKDVHFAVRFYGGDGCVIRNNRFTSLRQSGVLFTVKRGCSVLRNKVYGNYFEDLGDTAFAVSSDPEATREDEAAYNVIFGNTAKNTQMFTDGVAFDFETGFNEYMHHNIFANNTVEQTEPNGKRRGGLTMVKSDYSLVIGNTVKGVRENSSRGVSASGGLGVIIQGNVVTNMAVGISTSSSENALITGNTLIDCGQTSRTYPAVSITNSLKPFKDVVVTNNNFIWTSETSTTNLVVGLVVQNATGLPDDSLIGSGVIITNNVFKGCTGRAIFMQGASGNIIDDIVLKGNSFDLLRVQSSGPIYFRYCSNLKIIDNDIKDANIALTFHDCDSIRIARNIVSNNLSGSGLRYFSLGSDSRRASTNIIIEDNDFISDIPTPIVVSDKTIPTLVMRNNRGAGVLTANKGVVSSIATGATVNHGLAFTPTFIDLTTSTAGLTGFYVSDITDTSFKVNFAGSATADFMWKAEV